MLDTTHSYSIEAMRRQAKRRLPRMLFDFIDGGADDEVTRGRNVSRFDQIEFAPRVLKSMTEPDLSTSVFGQPLTLPIIVAPTGLSGLFWPQGEAQVARACAREGSIMTVSHATSMPLDQLASAADNPIWYQTLIYKDRGLTRELVAQAKASGYQALVLTVDLQALGQRERDIRNHFTVPPKITPRNALDALSHPRWLFDYLAQPSITMACYARDGQTDLATLSAHMSSLFTSEVSWDDVTWLRNEWDGPLIVKGLLHPEDAREAHRLNVDGIVVSNHGGRQLDTAPAPIDVLPAIKDAVGDDITVLLCSGIRRGTHVMKALSLGAQAVLIGRAHLFGLASGGQAGVSQVFSILREEMKRAMIMGGFSHLNELNQAALIPTTLPTHQFHVNKS